MSEQAPPPVRQRNAGGSSQPPGSTTTAASEFTGHVVVELGDNRNNNFWWAPTEQVVRGWWKRSNLHGAELIEQTETMPDIPGMRIEVDCSRIASGGRRRLRISDPLNLKEFENIMTELNSQARRDWGEKIIYKPEDELLREEEVSRQEVNTWLYHLYNLVKGCKSRKEGKTVVGGPQARVIAGELPDYATITSYAGGIRLDAGNKSPLYPNTYRSIKAIRHRDEDE